MALIKKCPLAEAVFDWEENVPSNGHLCNKVLQLHCPNDTIFEIKIHIKLVHSALKLFSIFNCKFPSLCTALCTMQMWKAKKLIFECKPFHIRPPESDELEFTSNCSGSVADKRINHFYGRIGFCMTLTIQPVMQILEEEEPTLEKLVKKLCLNQDRSDFKIICEGQELPCHKFVLSARSDVFQAMFDTKGSIENKEAYTYVDDIDLDTMKALLMFMYTDVVNVSDINADLLLAADKYNIKRLLDFCSRHLMRAIDATNVISIIMAAFLVSNDQLFAKASNFAMSHKSEIEVPEDWDQIKISFPEIAKLTE